MKNLIQIEYEESKKKMFETWKRNNDGLELVKLTRDNVAIAEAMIRNDSAYIRSGDKNYEGSTAHCMTLLKEVLIDKKQVSKEGYRELLKNAIDAVDRENSTRLNSDHVGPKEILDRLYNFEDNELVNCLMKPVETEYKLFKIIAEKTDPRENSPSGNPYKGRTNISFASKFCHYACFYFFEDEEYEDYQDNYSIYDRVLKKVIPIYVEAYGLDKKAYKVKDKDYEAYQKTIDAIREAAFNQGKEYISRNGLDHLLWYYHKGRLG